MHPDYKYTFTSNISGVRVDNDELCYIYFGTSGLIAAVESEYSLPYFNYQTGGFSTGSISAWYSVVPKTYEFFDTNNNIIYRLDVSNWSYIASVGLFRSTKSFSTLNKRCSKLLYIDPYLWAYCPDVFKFDFNTDNELYPLYKINNTTQYYETPQELAPTTGGVANILITSIGAQYLYEGNSKINRLSNGYATTFGDSNYISISNTPSTVNATKQTTLNIDIPTSVSPFIHYRYGSNNRAITVLNPILKTNTLYNYRDNGQNILTRNSHTKNNPIELYNNTYSDRDVVEIRWLDQYHLGIVFPGGSVGVWRIPLNWTVAIFTRDANVSSNKLYWYAWNTNNNQIKEIRGPITSFGDGGGEIGVSTLVGITSAYITTNILVTLGKLLSEIPTGDTPKDWSKSNNPELVFNLDQYILDRNNQHQTDNDLYAKWRFSWFEEDFSYNYSGSAYLDNRITDYVNGTSLTYSAACIGVKKIKALLYIPSPDWTPNNNILNTELRDMSSNDSNILATAFKNKEQHLYSTGNNSNLNYLDFHGFSQVEGVALNWNKSAYSTLTFTFKVKEKGILRSTSSSGTMFANANYSTQWYGPNEKNKVLHYAIGDGERESSGWGTVAAGVGLTYKPRSEYVGTKVTYIITYVENN